MSGNGPELKRQKKKKKDEKGGLLQVLLRKKWGRSRSRGAVSASLLKVVTSKMSF